MGSVLCEHCTGLCCKYIALPIDTPTTRSDFDDVRWYLMHEGVTIFVEDKQWYFQVATRCKNLQADNRCAIYPTRPRVCREYKAGQCDYNASEYGYEHVFREVAELEAYADQYLKKKRASRKPRQAG